MNETFNDDMTNTFCSEIFYSYQKYFEMSFSLFCFFLNFICIVVFMKIIRNQKINDDIFKYFLAKSIADTFLTLIIPLDSILEAENTIIPDLSKIYFFHVLNLIFGYYLAFCLQLFSMVCEIVACFSRYRMSVNKWKIFDKLSYKIVIGSIAIYCFGFYTYKFASLNIAKVQNNNSEDTWIILENELDTKMGYVHSFVRDGVCVFVIIALNVLTVVQLRKTLTRKRTLTKGSRSHRVQKAEIRLTLMVLTMSTFTFIGHGLVLINYLKITILFKNLCFRLIRRTLYWLSYEIDFFLLFF